MSDAPAAAQVPQNGAPPATQENEEVPGFKVTFSPFSHHFYLILTLILSQVFAGNLAYSTTDEGLKAFFAPVQSDMYVQHHL